MTTHPQGNEPILLAFSGGLDTSFCVPWLKDTYGRPVITVTVDNGGLDPAAAGARPPRSRPPRARRPPPPHPPRRVLRAGSPISPLRQRPAWPALSVLRRRRAG